MRFQEPVWPRSAIQSRRSTHSPRVAQDGAGSGFDRVVARTRPRTNRIGKLSREPWVPKILNEKILYKTTRPNPNDMSVEQKFGILARYGKQNEIGRAHV